MKSIVFLGAKAVGCYCLQYLQDHSKELDIEVIAVGIGNASKAHQKSNIQLIAEKYHIPILQSLDDLPECDFILSIQYHKILKAKHIAKARQLAVNLHMAPLPEYRGCNQFSFAILDEAEIFGTTLHQLEVGIDSGAILAEKRFSIPKGCWVQDLYQLTLTASRQLFAESIADILEGKYTPILQSELITERGTSYHFRKEINDIKQIDLQWSADKIERHIRATYFPPFEPPYTVIEGKKVYFHRENL
ncbi:MAG: formyltransferase family protein [Chitinophagales bacterium]